MTDHGAFQQVEAFRQRIALAAGKDQLSIALHRAQAATQGFKLLFAFNIQFYGQFFATGRFFTFR
ncbi:Uncharacterised protein [Salmonella enterica subsp. enterica serovar Typhi]|nr:Uncharacterised protein [Salmonella enterica subsp. enterica serovar Typhi]CGY09762.1 Uncharacterised protein [Salmonella enterica subsp. enterica serovar Typhi]CHI63699.1 Uncharacterised protein [Salmonella enterica subsp. enterica serovar Typhi]CHI65891.1 Uncharacterised protein [Salmonella enterica subsp. enterica serovar Typhi]CRB60780.1 Uncharacterised protein [Salmonella enterica subsp. enterica serovar Typhi]